MLKNIGNTPMIKISYKKGNSIKYIYAKLEAYNLTGSIKDRVALYIINNAKKEMLKEIKEHDISITNEYDVKKAFELIKKKYSL